MGLLTCLKNTGMPIKRIRDYVELTSKGDPLSVSVIMWS